VGLISTLPTLTAALLRTVRERSELAERIRSPAPQLSAFTYREPRDHDAAAAISAVTAAKMNAVARPE
jgi:hypothetical protein